MQTNQIGNWKDRQDLEQYPDDEEQSKSYAGKSMFKRFNDTGNLRKYNQTFDVALIDADAFLKKPAKWRFTIRADKDPQSFQSDDDLELLKLIGFLSNVYVQLKIRNNRSGNLDDATPRNLFKIKQHLLSHLGQEISIKIQK